MQSNDIQCYAINISALPLKQTVHWRKKKVKKKFTSAVIKRTGTFPLYSNFLKPGLELF